MRTAFIDTIVELAEKDERIVLLTGDLGFSVLEPFAERFPDRFFNVGVAEQNMVGIATGLAEAGFLPFTYSITTFATLRPFEFIRNGPLLHELPVRIVGVGSGLEYGRNGVTHFGLEDVAIMRTQPGMTVLAPADPIQARTALRATARLDSPMYVRLSKESKVVPGLDGRFELGRVATLGDGSDVLLVALGTIAGEAVQAAELLAAEHVDATVAVVSSMNPSPVDDLAELLQRIPVCIAIESHYVNGGLGSLVAEVIAERGLGCTLVRCGVREMPRGHSGSHEFLLELNGLSAARLAETALRSLTLATG